MIGHDDQNVLSWIESGPQAGNRKIDRSTASLEGLTGGKGVAIGPGPLFLINDQARVEKFVRTGVIGQKEI